MLGAVSPEHALLLDAGRLGVALDTISRIRSARCSPGTSCQAGSPLCLPKSTSPVGVTLGEEDPPAVVLHRHVVEVRPAVAADGDRRAQVDVLGRQRGPSVFHQSRNFGCQPSSARCSRRSSARLTLLGIRSE